MLPLTVITWKLENLAVEKFESLLLPEYMLDQILEILNHQFNGIYYLATCQRILIALEGVSSSKVERFINSYKAILKIDDIPNPEIYYEKSALKHLLRIVCALDSIVIGETEIQGQFKNSYNNSLNYLTPFLNYILTRVLRTGKRIRNNTILKNGKISTIGMVERILQQTFAIADSIAVFGTGKMGKGVIRYLKGNYENLEVYSRRNDITGTLYKGMEIKHVKDFDYHEILITATSTPNLIDKSFIMGIEKSKKWTIIDLGVPRNCNPDLNQLTNVSLYDMSKIIELSKSQEENEDLISVYKEIDCEFQKIIYEYNLKEQKDKIVNLRKDLWSVAEDHKDALNQNGEFSRDFELFVKELIHVSQKHLENALISKDDPNET